MKNTQGLLTAIERLVVTVVAYELKYQDGGPPLHKLESELAKLQEARKQLQEQLEFV